MKKHTPTPEEKRAILDAVFTPLEGTPGSLQQAGSVSWLPITIFLVVLFGGALVIGLYVAYGMPCPADWTGEWHQKWVSIQVRTFCLWSTAWALIVRAVSKIIAPRK